MTDFLEAIGIWVDELLVNRLLDAQYFSLMADECIDIANIEELSIYCRWEENGSPVEEILPLKKCPLASPPKKDLLGACWCTHLMSEIFYPVLMITWSLWSVVIFTMWVKIFLLPRIL